MTHNLSLRFERRLRVQHGADHPDVWFDQYMNLLGIALSRSLDGNLATLLDDDLDARRRGALMYKEKL